MTLDRNKPTISFEFAGLLVDWLNRESFGDRELVARILERKSRERIELPAWQQMLGHARPCGLMRLSDYTLAWAFAPDMWEHSVIWC